MRDWREIRAFANTNGVLLLCKQVLGLCLPVCMSVGAFIAHQGELDMSPFDESLPLYPQPASHMRYAGVQASRSIGCPLCKSQLNWKICK